MKPEIKLEEMVACLQKPGEDILQSLTPFKCNLWHHGIGLASEYIEINQALRYMDRENLKEEAGDFIFFAQGVLLACEAEPVESKLEWLKTFYCPLTEGTDKAVDLIKKHVIYGKDIDFKELAEVVLKALSGLLVTIKPYDLTMEECIENNKAKLAVRYNGFVYSDQAAKDRKDKQ